MEGGFLLTLLHALAYNDASPAAGRAQRREGVLRVLTEQLRRRPPVARAVFSAIFTALAGLVDRAHAHTPGDGAAGPVRTILEFLSCALAGHVSGSRRHSLRHAAVSGSPTTSCWWPRGGAWRRCWSFRPTAASKCRRTTFAMSGAVLPNAPSLVGRGLPLTTLLFAGRACSWDMWYQSRLTGRCALPTIGSVAAPHWLRCLPYGAPSTMATRWAVSSQVSCLGSDGSWLHVG